MLNFIVDQETCIGCGQCAADCPAQIITLAEGFPMIASVKEAACYKCQHCFAICPTGSISLSGLIPDESRLLAENLPDPDQVETLIKGRRAIRSYCDENLDSALLKRLLEVALHAPTARNSKQVLLTVIDDREEMAGFRDELMEGLVRLVREKSLPQGMDFFVDIVKRWEENRIDGIFRGAPHLLIASAPLQGAAPVVDCIIALSYFELFAQSMGVGTLWAGLAKWAIDDLLPQTKKRLEIPEDHVIGYVMVFGKPAVQYARTVQHAPAKIHFIS